MEKESKTLSPEALIDSLKPGFLDADKCRQWVLESLHPGGPGCPVCGAKIVDPGEAARFWSDKIARCPSCNKRFTAKSNTVLSGIGADFQKLVLFFLLAEMGMPFREIEKHVGLNKRTLFLYRHRFKMKK